MDQKLHQKYLKVSNKIFNNGNSMSVIKKNNNCPGLMTYQTPQEKKFDDTEDKTIKDIQDKTHKEVF